MRKILGLALLVLPLSAQAQNVQPSAGCPLLTALDAKVAAATSPAYAAVLPLGLHGAAELNFVDRNFFAVPPARKPVARTYGGTYVLEVPEAGTWRVALAARAFVDIAQGGKLLPSTAHGHLADGCFVKDVSFTLQPGSHLLQIYESPTPVLGFLVEKEK